MYDAYSIDEDLYMEWFEIEDDLINPGRVTLYNTTLIDKEYDKELHVRNIMLIKCESDKFNLENKTFESCYFDEFNLNSSQTGNTTFKNCTFYNSNICYTTFEKSKFINCAFVNVTFMNCNFEKSEFELCVIKDSIFSECSFTQLTFTTSHFMNVTLLSNCKIHSVLFNKESILSSCKIFSEIFNMLAMNTHFQDVEFDKIYENNSEALQFKGCILEGVEYDLESNLNISMAGSL